MEDRRDSNWEQKLKMLEQMEKVCLDHLKNIQEAIHKIKILNGVKDVN